MRHGGHTPNGTRRVPLGDAHPLPLDDSTLATACGGDDNVGGVCDGFANGESTLVCSSRYVQEKNSCGAKTRVVNAEMVADGWWRLYFGVGSFLCNDLVGWEILERQVERGF